jgi:hypothetical protein
MKFWYDTEFYEDGKTIDLISIGIVAENGRELYLENSEFDWSRVPEDHFVVEHVKPHLDNHLYGEPKKDIAEQVKLFIQNGSYHAENNELWGYYSSYDHVVLAQLFGRMVDMPEGIPWFTRDLKQWAEHLEYDQPFPIQGAGEHHALADARWNRTLYTTLYVHEMGML